MCVRTCVCVSVSECVCACVHMFVLWALLATQLSLPPPWDLWASGAEMVLAIASESKTYPRWGVL